MLISLAPLYHNKNYDQKAKSSSKDGGKVAHLLYATLNISAVSRDLSAIDKVYIYIYVYVYHIYIHVCTYTLYIYIY
jgi:hypothetical protein